jgi:hypothetical protein
MYITSLLLLLLIIAAFNIFNFRSRHHHPPILNDNDISVLKKIQVPRLSENEINSNKSILCHIGTPGEEWNSEDMRTHFRKFEEEIFAKGGIMTIDNEDGVLFHRWFIAYVIQKLNPKHMIESGAFRGRTTWLLRRVSPNAQLIIISPEEPTSYHSRNNDTIYLTGDNYKDFNQVDFDALGIDKNNTLIIFSDHQAGERRIREARAMGFRHLIMDDNYIPGCVYNCDNFSAKQACDAKDRLLWNIIPKETMITSTPSNEYYYDDYLSIQARKPLPVANMEQIYKRFRENVEIYFEAPPIYRVNTRFGIPQDVYDSFTKVPLFSEQEELGLQYINRFGNKQSDSYWNIAYIRLKDFPKSREGIKPVLQQPFQIWNSPKEDPIERAKSLAETPQLPEKNYEFSTSHCIQ